MKRIEHYIKSRLPKLGTCSWFLSGSVRGDPNAERQATGFIKRAQEGK